MDNRRRHARKAVDLMVDISVGDGPRRAAHVSDLSLGGMFAELEDPPAFGAEVTIFVHFPAAKKELEWTGTVRWAKPDGVGVQFNHLRAAATFQLTEFLADAEDIPDSRML